MFLEALGAAQFDVKNAAASVNSFRDALALTTNNEVYRRLEIETAEALRAVNASSKPDQPIEQQTAESLLEMPDSPIPSENGTGPDSSLVKPAPALPKIPTEIPNLPYPDL